MNKAKALLIGSRPWSFPMTLVSVFVGTLLAAKIGEFHFLYLVIVTLGMVLFHGATNLVNDYFDYQSGVDSRESPTARYRKQPLVENWMEPKELLSYSIGIYIVVVAIGAYLAYAASPVVLVFGIVGFAASYLYTGGGVGYKYFGWGELSVFLVWGPLMVTGSYYVQTGGLSLRPILVSIPLGLLVALVLLANNLRDREYDREAGVDTIATLMDEKDALITYFLLIASVYAIQGYLVVGGVLSLWGLLVYVSFPMAYKLIKTFFDEIPANADAMTAKLEIAFGGLLTVSLFFENVF